MHVSVTVEIVANNGFLARSSQPLICSATGATAEEAVDNLRDQLLKQLDITASSLVLEMRPPERRRYPAGGIYDPNDPWVKAWVETMAQNRQNDRDPASAP